MNWRRVITARTAGIVGAILAVAILSVSQFRLYRRQQQLEWEIELARSNYSRDRLSLDVGVIQFLRSGYSITMEKVTYGPAGVSITGRFGNPHFLGLSSLTLNFEIHKPHYQFREEYLNNPFFFFGDNTLVGKAQSAVGEVAPGSTAPFEVFIPNVRQGQQAYDLIVGFSGERYYYVR